MIGEEDCTIMGSMGVATKVGDPRESERSRGAEGVRIRTTKNRVCKQTDGRLRRRTGVSGEICRYGSLWLRDRWSIKWSVSGISRWGRSRELFVALYGIVLFATLTAGFGRNGSFEP